MIYQEIKGRRCYIDEYYAGDIQVVTRYTLNDMKYAANYLIPMDEHDNKSLWVVTDVYRFYCLKNNIIRQDKYEMFYNPRIKITDAYSIKSIKMFIERQKGFRTDWFCPDNNHFTYRTFETGNERDADYKKYEWTMQNQVFKNGDNFYSGDYANTGITDELLLEIMKINYNQTLKFYQDYKEYYNHPVKLKRLPF